MNEEEAKKELLDLFKEDIKKGIPPTVYTTLKHVSSSGMLRHIDVIYIKDNKPINLNFYIERLGLYKRAKNAHAANADSLRVSGCGMDMGFSVVFDLSGTLYQDKFICLGQECKSNDHVNGDRNYKPHKHSDGSYLLQQSWL